MTTTSTEINVVEVDTGPPGPHSGYKTLRIANVEGGSGDYTVTWRPLCDLSEDERQRISCPIDYRDEHPEDTECEIDPPCTFYDGTPTCCRTGTCGGDTVYTRYHEGETDRELIVTIENIPQFAQNVTLPACQLIFHWTVVDNVTGDIMDGCCGVIFQWKVITPAPLTITLSGCQTEHVVDTSAPSGSAEQTIEITSIAGGVGPYEVTWSTPEATDACVGTIAAEADDRDVTITNDNVPQFTLTEDPCLVEVEWTVRDTGLMNEFGAPIGRVETGTCSVEFTYAILNPPPLTAEVIGCNETITTMTGAPGSHAAESTMQIGEILGGTGNYEVTWNTSPSIATGTCIGDVVATVDPLNERLLHIETSPVPQFSDNTFGPCVRAYTALIRDLITDETVEVQCQVTFVFDRSNAPPLVVTLNGCGQTITANSGTCSTNRSVSATISLASITGGSGNYSVNWGTVGVGPTCPGVGSWNSTSTGIGGGPGSPNLGGVITSTFTALSAVTGTCPLTRTITVTDNVTNVETEVVCTITANAARVTDCGAMTAITSGCGSTITYNNNSGASGTTSTALLSVAPTGGSGSYTAVWNTTPTSVTGTCFGTQTTSVTNSGAFGKTLHVALTGIVDGNDNTSAPCVRTYTYTLTDTGTGQVVTGTCAVTFVIDQDEGGGSCALEYDPPTCGPTIISLTDTNPVTRTAAFPNVHPSTGPAPSGYNIAWALYSTCPAVAKFTSTGNQAYSQAGVAGSAVSAGITFQAPANSAGSCTVNVGASIAAVDGICGSRPNEGACTYEVTWNTQTTPSGVVNCGTAPDHLMRGSNTTTRNFSVSPVVNTTSIDWEVITTCPDLIISPMTGSGASFTVSWTAPNTGAGVAGSCPFTVRVILTGPGGSTQYNCSSTVTYDTSPLPPAITSITNCGQTKTLTTSTRSGSFASMTVNHTPGSGAPYLYEWTRINQVGACSVVTYTPSTASTQTITPTVSVAGPTGGTCTATYQVRVRDSIGVWSNPMQCDLTTTYPVIP